MNNRNHTRLTIEFLDVSSMNNRADTFITVENVDDVRTFVIVFTPHCLPRQSDMALALF
jgi:hypothetical protein